MGLLISCADAMISSVTATKPSLLQQSQVHPKVIVLFRDTTSPEYCPAFCSFARE